jgi:hypothetical protein
MARSALSAALLVLALSPAAMAADGVCRFAPGGPTAASNALERLVALTTDQRGIGGTGIVAQREARREERGLGGTGIIGVVTGFGSICVNGFEVALAADTTVTVEGLAAAQGDIRLGQIVAVEAYPAAGGLQAARVNVAVAVAGPVSAVSADRSGLTVAGQTVSVSNFGGSADIAAVNAGDWVVVSGLRRADDSIAGTSIVKLPGRGREVFVSGTARAVAGAVEIGGLTIAAPVAAGQTVAVRGTLAGNALEARAVDVVAASPFSRPMANVSVQGYGQRLANELQRLGIAAPAAAPADPAAPVQVDGSFATGGGFVPGRIETPAPPADGAVPSRPPAPPAETTRPTQSAPAAAPAAVNRPAAATPPVRPADRPQPPPEITRPERPTPPVRPERPAPPPDRPTRPEPPRPL